jgi:hypothetical protein
LFQSASGIVATYRKLLGAQRTVPDELAKVSGSAAAKANSATKPKK